MRVPTCTKCLRACLALLCGSALAGISALPIDRVLAQSSQNSEKAGSPAPTLAPTDQAQSPANSVPEMSAHDAPVPLRVRVNLVPVRVVVRDQRGHAVASLHKEDFQLFQDGKPQEISNFAVQTPDSLSRHVVQPQTVSDGSSSAPKAAAFLPPSRFVAFLFDDPHLNMEDVMQARLAASRYLDGSLTATDRVAIFTVSGQNQVDFTDDRVKLHKALLQLLPRDITGSSHSDPLDCTPMDYYEADLIQNQNDAKLSLWRHKILCNAMRRTIRVWLRRSPMARYPPVQYPARKVRWQRRQFALKSKAPSNRFPSFAALRKSLPEWPRSRDSAASS